jgi:hypothetical protein
MVAVMSMPMMYCRWSKYLAQDLFLQLPIDRSDTPAAVVGHGRPFTRRRKIIFTLTSTVVLWRIVARAHPRVRRSRSRWYSEKIVWNNVSIILKDDLRNWHDLLLMTDHSLLIRIVCGLSRHRRFLSGDGIFLQCSC